jgi:hypothetical protein
LHRTTPLHLIGPTGFADNVEHKLKAYTLNLLDAQSVDFAILARLFAKFADPVYSENGLPFAD